MKYKSFEILIIIAVWAAVATINTQFFENYLTLYSINMQMLRQKRQIEIVWLSERDDKQVAFAWNGMAWTIVHCI